LEAGRFTASVICSTVTEGCKPSGGEPHVIPSKAGEILGITQPHVSALMRNRSGAFSVERLMEFLTDLGHDVEITVRPTRKQQGKVSVVVAA
jgi:hypothetical protein